jgi:hypothetical protein
VQILISKPFHTRSAEVLWRRYRRARARIYGHPEVAALDIERVLVTHGRAVLSDGGAALRRALQREPWQRPKR